MTERRTLEALFADYFHELVQNGESDIAARAIATKKLLDLVGRLPHEVVLPVLTKIATKEAPFYPTPPAVEIITRAGPPSEEDRARYWLAARLKRNPKAKRADCWGACRGIFGISPQAFRRVWPAARTMAGLGAAKAGRRGGRYGSYRGKKLIGD